MIMINQSYTHVNVLGARPLFVNVLFVLVHPHFGDAAVILLRLDMISKYCHQGFFKMVRYPPEIVSHAVRAEWREFSVDVPYSRARGVIHLSAALPNLKCHYLLLNIIK